MLWEIEMTVARANLAEARRRCNEDWQLHGSGRADRDLKFRLAAALRRVRYLELLAA